MGDAEALRLATVHAACRSTTTGVAWVEFELPPATAVERAERLNRFYGGKVLHFLLRTPGDLNP